MFQVMFDLKRCRRLGLSENVKGDASDSDLFRSERGGSKVFTNFDLGIKKIRKKKNPFRVTFSRQIQRMLLSHTMRFNTFRKQNQAPIQDLKLDSLKTSKRFGCECPESKICFTF